MGVHRGVGEKKKRKKFRSTDRDRSNFTARGTCPLNQQTEPINFNRCIFPPAPPSAPSSPSPPSLPDKQTEMEKKGARERGGSDSRRIPPSRGPVSGKARARPLKATRVFLNILIRKPNSHPPRLSRPTSREFFVIESSPARPLPFPRSSRVFFSNLRRLVCGPVSLSYSSAAGSGGSSTGGWGGPPRG